MTMALLTRRNLLAAGGTVLGAAYRSKPAGAQEKVEMRPFSAILPARPPATLPPVGFTTLDGKPAPLAAYACRPVVLNFWATWCVPCVAELPELDRLAATGAFSVLVVSADRMGASVVRPFVAAHGITHATVLLDAGSVAVHLLGVAGFPTTLLIGADGKLRGTLEGPAAWGGGGAAISKLLVG